ncbi:PREDICTED: aminopeptidase N [Condylura cristata]|uniref:aminopeptidase N n=1 Tax=Condylura cristata TaxID=143302 RepID=UPI0006439474|nr:PREDICTED: aminopeptidase N [Condylura cristata]
MGNGFFISKTVGILGILLGVAAVSTIIALSVVYAQEKSRNDANPPTVSATTTTTTTTTPKTSTTTITTTPKTSTTTTTTTPKTTTKGPVTPTSPSATTVDQDLPWNSYRLPTWLSPDSYSVTLRPYLTPNSEGLYIFEGNSTVRFTCMEPTPYIIIHSKKLNYTTAGNHMVLLEAVDGSPPPKINKTELVEATEYLVVHLEDQLEVNKMYEMRSSFRGELADDLAGFYRSEYMEDGVKKVVATTQMQAADARKSFPCFDEPAMKARFNITIIHPKNYKALSNMPPIHNSTLEGNPDWQVTTFNTTPKMSTYLLAYIVSEFDQVEAMSPDGVQIRIWARPKAIKDRHGDYALNVTGPILSFFTKHYNTSYPLEKSDQIGLPDFNAGAMENWGLVTYRENSLLYDPKSSSIGNKERVVTVISHELAHQWFGNLVTVAWWNDLWLNEGFASYVEYLGADSAEPAWNLKDLMVLNEVYRVMAVDALASSHPLSSPADEVNTPAQISELFDSISYSKGASVLRMLSHFLNETVFQQGLASYLQTFAYNNTRYTDLWDHLQEAVNQNNVILPDTVSNIMDRWILQMGFPVITVDTSSGEISQKHFLLDPLSNVTRPSKFNYRWIAYITSIKSGSPQDSYWLNGEEKNQSKLFEATGSDWVLLNINATGYFVVNYDQANWKKIQAQLEQNLSVIPVINRAQVIHDAFNLASAETVDVTLALDTTLFLDKEIEYMPWQAALDSLSYFKLMFEDSEVYGPMKAYLKKQVLPLYQHFQNITGNWTNRPPTLMAQYNEVNAISTACTNGVTECHTMVKELFAAWMSHPDNNTIHPNLRSTVYCNAIALGGEREWDFAWGQFRNATLVNEADKLRSALACSRELWILNRYLGYTLNATLIRRQDATSTISSIASNVVGQNLVWNFVQSNWKKLFEELLPAACPARPSGAPVSGGAGLGGRGARCHDLARPFVVKALGPQRLEQFKKDNMDTGFGSGTRALEQALERTKANIKWVAKNKAPVLNWFTSKI